MLAGRVGVALSSEAVHYDPEEQKLVQSAAEAEREVRELEHEIHKAERKVERDTEHSTDSGTDGPTFSAAPQLRDIEKEVTTFVPPSVRRAQKKRDIGETKPPES